MKRLNCILLFLSLSFFSLNLFCQNSYQVISNTSKDGKYHWTEVTNDPSHTRFYTLANGFQVILTENHNEPRIMCLITTKAGSKNDPPTHTGLAHYLEHMLFKGTDQFGTLDYTQEKMLLDQIENLYEVYNSTQDQQRRKSIYHEIDSISGVASKFAIANEYDKMLGNIGSNMTNAFTSFENTTYMENIPSNNLNKFLEIQKERFRNPVLRLFHTELEAVYEEKNISLDNGSNKIFETMFASLFKHHPYGTQTTIGTIEHLKNPSLKEIQKYFYKYYIPNNMSMILAGDFQMDQTIAIVDQYFGDWASKEIPDFSYIPEVPRTTIEEYNVTSPDEESMAIGFLMPNQNDKEAIIADLVGSILYNGKSGLIDKNLVKNQKVLSAFGFTYLLKDYGMMYFGGNPLENQSLKEVKNLVIEQIEHIKSGNFDEDLIKASINNLKVQRIKEQESATNMAFVLNDLFAVNRSWDNYLRSMDDMNKITKKDVIQFANKWFKNNYTVVYKLTGNDTTVQKVDKPTITPVSVNRESQSPFLKKIIDNPSPAIKPVFVDYKKDIKFGEIKKDLPVWMVPNTRNKLFEVYYVLDMGSNHNQLLPLAIEYLKFIGTSKKSNEQINKEFYNLAVNFNMYSSKDQTYIGLSGLDENFDAAVQLMEEILNDPKPDQKALDELIKSKIKSRNDATLNKDIIFYDALDEYLRYGKNNSYNNVISNQKLKTIKANELTTIIKSLKSYKHRIYYYGPRSLNTVVRDFKKSHKTPEILKIYPVEKKYHLQVPKENTIYFVNYDMVQAEIQLNRSDKKFDSKLLPYVKAFNEYYGGGMASVVFQDIRESKALAYSTYASFVSPDKKEDPYEATFYVGTQADKLSDALTAVNHLLNDMPESEKNWEIGKKSIKQGIETRRISKSQIMFKYEQALRLGLKEDSRIETYNQIDQISLNDIKQFHKEHLKDKPWNMKLLGSKEKINMEELKKYGKVVELSLKDIFGYDVEKTESIKP
ncbi:MAG: insulinase family protein [Saprospiraceae bacterium]|nr:insulinase family protein [Candidatus Defluviibacterium haderslevense]